MTGHVATLWGDLYVAPGTPRSRVIEHLLAADPANAGGELIEFSMRKL